MSWYDKLNDEDYWVKLEKERRAELYVTKGYDEKDIGITAQPIYSNHEYTLISQADETVFAEDETGAPHVFTIEEWNAIKGKKNDGTGFLLIAAVAAGLMLL
jgi:hypothetical protein